MARNFGGIAQGLETGIRLAQSIEDRKDRKAQNEREYGLRAAEQSSRLSRQAATDEREAANFAVSAAEDEHRAVQGDFTTALARYKTFDAMPPEVQARLTERARGADTARTAARTKRNTVAFGPREQQDLSDIVSNLQTGRVQLDDVPPDQLYLAVANATRRDPADFMTGPDGSPSPISRAVGDITTGLETGNNGMVVSGANVLLAPELRRGIGSESPHGGKIVFKEIDRLIPHPNDPSKVTPVLRVYVDQGEGFKGPRGKHQETSYYLAPLTEGRSGDPSDPVKFIDMQAAMDRVGQLGMLTEVMGQPDFRTRMEEGRRSAGDRTKMLVDSYVQLGQPKVRSTAYKLPADSGTTLIENTDDRGNVVGTRELKHPDRPVREKTFEAKLAAIEADEDLTDDQKERLKAKVLGGIDIAKPLTSGKGGGGAGGKGGAGKVTEAEVKGTIKDAERHIAASLGLQVHPTSKKWVGADGKPADPAKVEALNEAVRKAGVLIRDNQAAGKKTGLTPALEAAAMPAAKPAAKPANDQFVVGKIYRNGKGQQAEYLGQGKWKEVK